MQQWDKCSIYQEFVPPVITKYGGFGPAQGGSLHVEGKRD